MQPKSKFEVINPPNLLASKVKSHGGPELDQVVKEAQEALSDLQESYIAWVCQDLDRMLKLLDQAKEDPRKASLKLKDIFLLSHDIKGQGATFEYPLLSHITGSLCKLLSDETQSPEILLTLTRLHVEALNVVVKENIRGAGGTQGKELVEMLRMAVAKVLGT